MRLIVSYAAGNVTDSLARVIAEKLAEKWGQPVNVDNRPGQGGSMGAQIASKAPADGYTLLFSAMAALAINPHVYANVGYDVQRDFLPIVNVAYPTSVMVASPDLKISRFADLVAYSKANPTALNYGTAGNGTVPHLNMEALKAQSGLIAQHVPYKAAAAVMTDVMGGRLQLQQESISVVLPQIKAGKLVPIAAGASTRLPQLPDVPTLSELVPGYVSVVPWLGILAPVGTPRAIVDKVHQDVGASAAPARDAGQAEQPRPRHRERRTRGFRQADRAGPRSARQAGQADRPEGGVSMSHAAASPERPAPLSGVRIVDLTTVLAGPYCTYQLALLGAEVIKLERPDGGDWARLGSRVTAIPEFSNQFVAQNADKKSICIDLKQPQGRDLALQLMASADVVVENFSAGVADRLGIGFDAVRERRPDIVYCALSGYGQDGPMSRRPAYDHVVQAASGITLLNGTPESAPNRIGPPLFDYLAGMYGAFAVMAALRERDRTGQAQMVDVAMLDAAMVAMASTVSAWSNGGIAPKANGNTAASGSPASGIFETAHGLLSMTANQDAQLDRLCRVAGLGRTAR